MRRFVQFFSKKKEKKIPQKKSWFEKQVIVGFWGGPQAIFIFISRSWHCAGFCTFPPQKTRFFE